MIIEHFYLLPSSDQLAIKSLFLIPDKFFVVVMKRDAEVGLKFVHHVDRRFLSIETLRLVNSKRK